MQMMYVAEAPHMQCKLYFQHLYLTNMQHPSHPITMVMIS